MIQKACIAAACTAEITTYILEQFIQQQVIDVGFGGCTAFSVVTPDKGGWYQAAVQRYSG